MSEFEKVLDLLQTLREHPRAFFEQVPNHDESDILEYKASFEYDLALDLCPHIKKKPGWKPKNPALALRVLESIIAFANTKGGLIVFGVHHQNDSIIEASQCDKCIDQPLRKGLSACLEQFAQMPHTVVGGPLHICGISSEVTALHGGHVTKFRDRLDKHFAFGTKGMNGDIVTFKPAYYPCVDPKEHPITVKVKTNIRWWDQVETLRINYKDDETLEDFDLYAILVKPADEAIIMSVSEQYSHGRQRADKVIFKVRIGAHNTELTRSAEHKYIRERFHSKNTMHQPVQHEPDTIKNDTTYWTYCEKLGMKGCKLYLARYGDGGEYSELAKLMIEELGCLAGGHAALANAPERPRAPEPEAPERAADSKSGRNVRVAAEPGAAGPASRPRTAKPARGEHTTRADFSPTATTFEDTTGCKFGDLLRAKISSSTANTFATITPRNEQHASEQKAKKVFCEAGRTRFPGKLPQAIECYTQAILLNPNFARAYRHRGVCHAKLGDHDKAIADYSEAIRLKPDDAVAYYGRGASNQELGNHGKAVADFTEAIRLKPAHARTYRHRALSRQFLGHHHTAITDFSEAIRLKPDDASAYCGRGESNQGVGDYDKAIADFSKAIRLKSDDAAAYHNRAECNNKLKNYDKAIADYTEVIRLQPDDAFAYSNRGRCHQSIGDSLMQNVKSLTGNTTARQLSDIDATGHKMLGDKLIEKFVPSALSKAQSAYRQAIIDYTATVRLCPDFSGADTSLRNAMLSLEAVQTREKHTDVTEQTKAKLKVKDLAAELGVDRMHLLQTMWDMGIQVKSFMSTLEDDEAERLRLSLRGQPAVNTEVVRLEVQPGVIWNRDLYTDDHDKAITGVAEETKTNIKVTKLKVKDLAAELGIGHKEILQHLRDMDIQVKSFMSTLEDDEAERLRLSLRGQPAVNTEVVRLEVQPGVIWNRNLYTDDHDKAITGVAEETKTNNKVTKLKVKDLAAELGIGHKEILQHLRDMDIQVKSFMSTLEDDEAERLRLSLRGQPAVNTEVVRLEVQPGVIVRKRKRTETSLHQQTATEAAHTPARNAEDNAAPIYVVGDPVEVSLYGRGEWCPAEYCGQGSQGLNVRVFLDDGECRWIFEEEVELQHVRNARPLEEGERVECWGAGVWTECQVQRDRVDGRFWLIHAKTGKKRILRNEIRGSLALFEGEDIRRERKNDFYEVSSETEEAHYSRGKALCTQRRFDLAIMEYTKAISANQNRSDIFNDRGFAYRMTGEQDRAISDFSEAIRLNPDFSLAYKNRGFVYRKRKDFLLAIKDYTAAIRLEPNDATAYKMRGDVYRENKSFLLSIDDYTEAIRLRSDYAEAYKRRGDAYVSKRSFALAVPDYSKAIEYRPNDATGHKKRGDAYCALLRYQNAIQDYTEAIRIRPNVTEAIKARGDAYFKSKNYYFAKRDYADVIRMHPDYSFMYFLCGLCFSRLNQIDQAIAWYDKALTLDPKNTTALFARANAHKKNGSLWSAIQDYTECIKRDPLNANAFCNRGYSYRKVHDNDKAIADFTQALQINPVCMQALCNRGYVYCETGEYPLAISDFTRAIGVSKCKSRLYIARAKIYIKMGETNLAGSDFRAARRERIKQSRAIGNK